MACEENTEEMHFVNLFEDTLAKNRGSLSDDEISKAVNDINELFQTDISCPMECYRTPARRWGYFFKMSFLSAGLARFYVLEALRNSEEFRTFFKRPSLKVLSIGSGPGNDLIGLCSALYGNADFQKLDLILLDYNELWKPLFDAMIDCTRSGNYGNSSGLFKEKHVKCYFVPSDVLNTDKYKKHLKNADIVWMKGLLSVLSSDSVRKEAIKVSN
ncbi:uncharacterized protein TNCV_1976011 [Trichonephila clavipes]|nr:uncharacterized protein TNCV_1976011 [Trichonephila clavipes]